MLKKSYKTLDFTTENWKLCPTSAVDLQRSCTAQLFGGVSYFLPSHLNSLQVLEYFSRIFSLYVYG